MMVGRPGRRRKMPAWYVDEHTIGFKPSNRDAVILIDAKDFDRVKNYTWSLNSKGIPTASIGGEILLLYWWLHARGDTLIRVQYRNGNKLDNRRANICVYIAGERPKVCYPSVEAARISEEQRWTL